MRSRDGITAAVSSWNAGVEGSDVSAVTTLSSGAVTRYVAFDMALAGFLEWQALDAARMAVRSRMAVKMMMKGKRLLKVVFIGFSS